MLEKKDKDFFEDSIDKIKSIAEGIGIKINIRSRVALRAIAIFLALATIGSLYFVFTLIKRSIIKNK